EKQDAVVLLRLAELPGAEQLIGVGFDVAALQRLHRGDNELDAGFVFQRFGFRLDVALALRRHHAGLIDHAAGECREVERQCDGRRQAEDQDDSYSHHPQPPDAPPPPDEPPPPEKPLSDELPPDELPLLQESLFQLEECEPVSAVTSSRRPWRLT